MDKIAVIVTTSHRGVFFGYIDPARIADTTLDIGEARMVTYWCAHGPDGGGIGRLADVGPVPGDRIGSRAGEGVVLHGVTAVWRCTAVAAAGFGTRP